MEIYGEFFLSDLTWNAPYIYRAQYNEYIGKQSGERNHQNLLQNNT